MLTLTLAVFFALAVSAACSLTETTLYAVTWAHIEKLRTSPHPTRKKSGELLYILRQRVDKPIAAVLTLNTIANTAGSAVAGAAFVAVFGAQYMVIFVGIFTLLVLIFGEIVPKTYGVAYANALSAGLARPLMLLSRLLGPIIWFSGLLTRMISPSGTVPPVNEDDIRAVASLSRQAGRIQPFEERTIRNILALDRKRVRDIMTPRTVVYSLSADTLCSEALSGRNAWSFSRVPVYEENNEDLVGIVDRRAIAQHLLEGKNGKLGDIMRPLHFILENQTLDALLQDFLNSRTHLYAVLDEYGGLSGVVSLEDVLEEILGREIMDETDSVANLRTLARERRARLTMNAGEKFTT